MIATDKDIDDTGQYNGNNDNDNAGNDASSTKSHQGINLVLSHGRGQGNKLIPGQGNKIIPSFICC